MKYTIRVNFSGCLEKKVEADCVEEAEELAQDWWDELDSASIVEHTTLDEIDVEDAR